MQTDQNHWPKLFGKVINGCAFYIQYVLICFKINTGVTSIYSDVLMMQDDNFPNCPINELPFSPYDIMFTPLGKSQSEQEPDQN